MPTQYETSFTILPCDDLGGAELLQAVIEAIESELQSSDGATDYELENNRAGAVGYAHFSGERSHPSLPAAVRLEARLCTRDDTPGVAVQILTRFISADGADLPERAAGPPRLLDAITGQFRCRVGASEISGQPIVLNADNAENFARDQLLNPERTLPIFLITQDSIDPAAAQRGLQGVAQVAYCNGGADQELATHTGIRTYGGAVRIYWPHCQPGHNGPKPVAGIRDFYMPGPEVQRLSLYEVQKACLAGEPGIDFDGLFSIARSAVVQERNRRPPATAAPSSEPESASPAVATTATTATTVAEPEPEAAAAIRAELKEQQRAQRMAEVRSLEANRKLQAAQHTIERLTQEKAQAEETISSLEAEISERAGARQNPAGDSREERSQLRQQVAELRSRATDQEKTIARLNDDNQLLRQRQRARDDGEGLSIRLGSEEIGNITTLNHALNIYRGPGRKFIVRKLQAAHGLDLTVPLNKSVEFGSERQRRDARMEPEAAFDIRDFSAIISANPHCFADWQSLYKKMDDVRRIRNVAAHPRRRASKRIGFRIACAPSRSCWKPSGTKRRPAAQQRFAI